MKKLLLVCLLCFSAIVSAGSVNQIVVFGDSLSDNGNLYEFMKHQLPLSPPYYKGRFANGPIWIELVMQHYYPNNPEAHLLDYAFGGAGVLEGEDIADGLMTLNRELDNYFLPQKEVADANSLYVVWIGSNNYIASPEDPLQTVIDVTTGIMHGLERLIRNGAKHIMVVNVPDMGLVPGAKDINSPEFLTYLSVQHNLLLRQKYNELQKKYPDIEWIYYDVFSSLKATLEHPETEGFTNITDTCYEELGEGFSKGHFSLLKMVSSVNSLKKADACDGFFFFDPVHPGAKAHELMADRIIKLFDETGIEFH